ncbi:hypothetical protein NSIN_40202 [Nitrosotalea sinensis]|uniref:Uncharacterized protein n=1 Tax=Nitrosotalea sinensis TaxID=1499975 RepID=A0A2H1EJ06_9ARCH|nr:hypothetical protein NSIN_40202 [Candidatus Nitrosotalea sinensis]
MLSTCRLYVFPNTEIGFVTMACTNGGVRTLSPCAEDNGKDKQTILIITMYVIFINLELIWQHNRSIYKYHT